MDKQFLYHRVPEDMKPDEEGRGILYPLNMLKEKFPGLYEIKGEKYDQGNKRKSIPEIIIPTLQEAAWGDVLHLTAIHPADLKKALVEAGFHPEELKFYQIDPAALDPEKTTIYLYRDGVDDSDPDNFAAYHPEELEPHSVVPEITKDYYREKSKQKETPLLFVGVPHIFHKGSIDISNFPVITTEMPRNAD